MFFQHDTYHEKENNTHMLRVYIFAAVNVNVTILCESVMEWNLGKAQGVSLYIKVQELKDIKNMLEV